MIQTPRVLDEIARSLRDLAVALLGPDQVEVIGIESGDLPQSLRIQHCHFPPIELDKPFLAQLPQGAVDVDGGQPGCVCELVLGDRPRHHIVIGRADGAVAHQHLKDEVRDAFPGVAAADIDKSGMTG